MEVFAAVADTVALFAPTLAASSCHFNLETLIAAAGVAFVIIESIQLTDQEVMDPYYQVKNKVNILIPWWNLR